MPLDDADLVTHLLHMCPAKWQTQYNLMENTTPISTRALLLILENIKRILPRSILSCPLWQNWKGPMGSARLSRWTPVSPRNPREWAGPRSTACHTRRMEGRTRATTCMTAIILTRSVLLSKGMGVQVSPIQRKREAKVQTLCRFSMLSWTKHSTSTHKSTRNIALTVRHTTYILNILRTSAPVECMYGIMEGCAYAHDTTWCPCF